MAATRKRLRIGDEGTNESTVSDDDREAKKARAEEDSADEADSESSESEAEAKAVPSSAAARQASPLTSHPSSAMFAASTANPAPAAPASLGLRFSLYKPLSEGDASPWFVTAWNSISPHERRRTMTAAFGRPISDSECDSSEASSEEGYQAPAP